MRLLDLFCGAGGSAMGYSRAGFTEIVGVDIVNQPRYPFTFVKADAMTFPLDGFDAIHASPPCQGESVMRYLPWLRDKEYPMLIIPIRERLQAAGIPYVIENVYNARRSSHKPYGMQAGWLCGQMFGLPIYWHRLFETSFPWLAPAHPTHRRVIQEGRMLGSRLRVPMRPLPSGDSAWEGTHRNAETLARIRQAKGIDWMTADELSQAIPPIYTEYIGSWLLKAIRSASPPLPTGSSVRG